MGLIRWLRSFLSNDDLTVVTFGDSLTTRHEGHDEPLITLKLEQLLPDLNWINAGHPGDDVLSADKRFEKDVLRHHPDIVTILFGTNDSSFHHNVSQIEFRQTLIKWIEEIGSERVILITPPPVDEAKQLNKRTNERINAYRTIIITLSQKYQIPLIDLFLIFKNDSRYPEILHGERNDGLHFGEAGYNLYAASIAKCLREHFLTHP